jgi:hypothetical protein
MPELYVVHEFRRRCMTFIAPFSPTPRPCHIYFNPIDFRRRSATPSATSTSSLARVQDSILYELAAEKHLLSVLTAPE